MIVRRILLLILVFFFVLLPQRAITQQKTTDETISLDGINLHLGMQKSEVMDLLGKKYLLKHYGGKEDVWWVYNRKSKHRPDTGLMIIHKEGKRHFYPAGYFIACIEFKNKKISSVFKRLGKDISSLLSLLEEYNRDGKFIAKIKTSFIGNISFFNNNKLRGTAQDITMTFGKKYIIIIVATFKGQSNITEVSEVLEE